jgi:hypothetical protein
LWVKGSQEGATGRDSFDASDGTPEADSQPLSDPISCEETVLELHKIMNKRETDRQTERETERQGERAGREGEPT